MNIRYPLRGSLSNTYSVPTFVNNVLAEHMEKYRDIIDETCHRKFKEMMVWKDSSICR